VKAVEEARSSAAPHPADLFRGAPSPANGGRSGCSAGTRRLAHTTRRTRGVL